MNKLPVKYQPHRTGDKSIQLKTAEQVFYPYFGGLDNNTSRVILGNGQGKFHNNGGYFQPMNERMFLLDTSPGSLMKVAMNVPHLNTVLSTGGEYFSMMRIKHVDKNGVEVKNSEILNFIRQPNVLQITEQYLYEFYIINGVYNKTAQYEVKGLSFETLPDALWILPSGFLRVNTTGKIYRQTDIKKIIENFELVGSRESEFFETENVIYMVEGLGNNPLKPISRLEALQIPLSNIMAGMKSYNMIVTEKGMIGFLGPDSPKNDGDGYVPFGDTERIRLEDEYQSKYNLDSGRGHVSFTSANIKWVPMSFPVNDLMLFEGEESAFAKILDAYRLDRDIFSSIKGATYENKAAGLKYSIQNGLQPLADKLMAQWTKRWCDPKKGDKLIADYSHLPAMKEDERLAAQGKLYQAQANEVMLNNGVINHDAFAEDMGVQMSGDKVIIQRSQPKPTTNE